MKGEEGKIKKHRKRKGRVNWLKRSLAVCLAAATLMTGVGLESVFADEAVSTGKVETQQSAQTEVQTQAETGEADENTAAANAADPADHNNDPESVTTGGEATDSQQKQTADSDSGQTSNESQSTDSKAEAAIQGSEKNTADGTDAAGTNAADSAADMSDTAGTELPETIPVEQLKANLKAFQAQSTSVQQEEQIQVWQYYREERDYLLSTQSAGFAGGMMDNSNVPKSLYGNGAERKYTHAELVYNSGTDYENTVEIIGLYPGPVDGNNPVQWYYVLKENNQSVDAGDYGTVSVGHKLPETKGNETVSGTSANVEIRFFYTAESTKSHKVTVTFDGIQNKNNTSKSDWNISVNGKTPANDNLSAPLVLGAVADGSIVPFNFTLPGKYEYAEVEVITSSESGASGTTTIYTTKEGAANALEKSESERSYSGYFVTLDGDTTVNFKGYPYGTNSRLYFAAYSDMAVGDRSAWDIDSNPNTRGGARVYTKSGNVAREQAGGSDAPKYDLRADTINGQTWGYSSLGDIGYGMGSYREGGEPHVMSDIQTRLINNGFRAQVIRANKGWTGSTAGLQIDSNYSDNSGLIAGDGGKVKVVRDPGTGKTDTVPVGQYTPGSEVSFMFDSISNNYSVGYSFVPVSLAMDVYTSNDDFSTEKFERQNFVLPTNGKTVSYNLNMGGKITIKNVYWQKTNPTYPSFGNQVADDNNVVLSPNDLTNPYALAINDTGYLWVDTQTRWYSYEVTVSGCAYPFKLFQSHSSGAQRGAILTEASGVELGTGLGGSQNEKDITASYVLKSPSHNADPLYYPLITPYVFYGYNIHSENGAQNAVQLGLKPKRGYTKPKIEISDSSRIEITSGNGHGTQYPVGEAGRYTYHLKFKGNNNNFNQPPTFKIKADPIQVQVLYKDSNNGGNQEQGVVMGYGGNGAALNTVLKSFGTAPSGKYFNGFTLTVKRGNETLSITNPNSSAGQTANIWHIGELVSFDEIYSQMEKQFLDETTTNYTLEIVPQYADQPGADSLIDGTFTIRKQKGFNSGNAYQENAFEKPTSYTLKAVNGSPSVVVGYEKQIKTNGRTYVFGQASQTEGTVTVGTPFAHLYYLYGTSVQIDSSGINDILSGSQEGQKAQEAITTFNEANKDRYYTSVSGENNVIDYADVYTALSEKSLGDFKGFAAKVSGTTYSNLILPEKTGIDFNKLYGGNSVTANNPYTENYRDIWEALFTATGTDGVLTLVPVYESSKIESTDETDLIQENAEVITYTGGDPDPDKNDGSFLVGGTFKYTGDVTGLNDALFAVTKQEKQHRAGSSEIEKENTKLVGYGKISTDGRTIAINSEGGVYFENARMQLDAAGSTVNSADSTFNLAFQKISTANNLITYQWEDDAIYGVHVWGKGNSGGPDIAKLADLARKSSGDSTMVEAGREIQGLFLDEGQIDIPGVTTNIQVQPKEIATRTSDREQAGGSVQQITKPDSLKIHAETDFEITAGFMIDENYPKDLQIGDSAAEDARVHIALYKENPGNNSAGWHSWVFDGKLTSGAEIAGSGGNKTSTGSIDSGSSGEATVTFPIYNRVNNNGNPTVSWQWDDGAKYCIVAWNKSNTDNVNFTDDTLKPGGTNAEKAPSVTTDIALQWQESSYYVYIPANVVLTEDEAKVSGGAEGYAGATATIRYKNSSNGNPAEGNNEKDQPEVEVKVEADKAMTEEATGNKTMTMGIYGTDGTKRQITQETLDPTAGTKGNYAWVGVLKNTGDSTETTADTQESIPTGKSISYQINAKTNNGDARGTSYTGTVEYILTLRDYVRPTS